MPELPEVETVRAGLATLIDGATIRSAVVLRDSCVRLLPGGPAQFTSMVADARIGAVVRRGKFLWLPLLHGDDAAPAEALSAHLGMSGQFRVHEGAWGDAPAPHSHCRARLRLERDGAPLTLDFLDQRTFGVNLLCRHQEALAGAFSGRTGLKGEDRFHIPDHHWTTLKTGAPILEGALASLDCEVTEQQSFSTHTIFIGAVRDGNVSDTDKPLLYFRGDFWDLTSPA